MRSHWLTWICVICCVGLMAHADPCVVTSSSGSASANGSLPALVQAIAETGACRVESNTLRDLYGDALGMAQQAHVIQWTTSMQITLESALPVLQAHGSAPLVLRADDGVLVRIRGSDTVRLGGSGPVILDGLTFEQFPGPALQVANDDNLLRRIRVRQSGRSGEKPDGAAVVINGSRNRFEQFEVTQNSGVGIWIDDHTVRADCAESVGARPASNNQLSKSVITHNGAAGIWMHGYRATLTQSRVADNGSDGIIFDNPAEELRACKPASMKDPAGRLHTMQIHDATFGGNGGSAIVSATHALPAPVDLIAMAPLSGDTMVVVGNIGRIDDAASFWQYVPLDVEQIEVEIYLSDGGEGIAAVGRARLLDRTSRQFVARIPYPLQIDGRPVTNPQLTAVTIDTEHRATSVFAAPLDLVKQGDWDHDGLSNTDEDANGNGVVDLNETNPRLPDSDGDLVNDGDEFTRGINPRLADTDGDCLPDGLELGRTGKDLPPWPPSEHSVLPRPRMILTDTCRNRLNAKKITQLEHAVAWDPSQAASAENLAALPDSDPATTTDPLVADSDRDGIADGDEDWNWDGQRNRATVATADAAQSALLGTAGEPLETDPAVADSDGDGVLDGDEGDRNNSGTLDANETDALRTDTDDDGLTDGDEIRRYGTEPNRCDTDGDGLGDGLETGAVHPTAAAPQCVGLQTAGSNFASIGALDPLRADADADGIPDGAEDTNANGWLDAGETDPTTADTDSDGLSDFIEVRGDLDADGVADWLLANINNGSSCAPPTNMSDLDCDGVPNARDDDSDNDGCLDRDEGVDAHGDRHGIPAAYQSSDKQCNKAASGGSSSGGATPDLGGGTPDTPPGLDPDREYFSQQIGGGGSCALVIP